ncbi:MAG: PHP domain-containing protein [Tepidanaerobacteraceae bacterium]|jgi:PHP family Zn ribbon phosphoesterase
MFDEYPADLHIHTCLSPCADDEMNPINILNMAKLQGTKILGICDHNSAKNIGAMLEAAKKYDILVIPGMEVQSAEEVHLICLFESLKEILEMQEFVYKNLPKVENEPSIFGRQLIVDAQGRVIKEERQMLLTSTMLTVEQISAKVSRLNGIFIPAHIDKRSFSLLGQLGFIPEGLDIKAVEFSRNIGEADFKKRYKINSSYTLITNSDAHRLIEMVFQKTFFYLKSLSFGELVMALEGKNGRGVIVKEG